jgi:NADH:ubiquinone oxidoreductase subunit 4 (subunit M)
MTLDVVVYMIRMVKFRFWGVSIKLLMFPQCFWTPLRHVRASSPIDVRLTTKVAASGSAVRAHATGHREISV